MKAAKVVKLSLSIFLCQSAGLIGSLFTFSAIPTWYAGLTKPFFSPPNWLFGPAWLTLYTLMGISFFIIWQVRTKKNPLTHEINLFLVHLALNSLWSIVFFGLKNPGLAFVEIGILWLMIVEVIKHFGKINRTAAILLYPYLAWVSFASLLNAAVWFLN